MTGPSTSGAPLGLQAGYTSSETYHRGDNSPSWIRDMATAARGDWDAAKRLATNNEEVRALTANLGAGGGGSDFAPPLWASEYIAQARSGGVTASIVHQEPLPAGVSSVTLPRILNTGGTSVAVQTVELEGVSNVDANTDRLTSHISTISGQQIISQQLLDQSPSYSGQTFDQMILGL